MRLAIEIACGPHELPRIVSEFCFSAADGRGRQGDALLPGEIHIGDGLPVIQRMGLAAGDF